ncbi:MAG: hypothetical protein JW829_20560 [Pirellulales bacterium]|nr:hypothetical protein [Pirellulales bacterium]
MSTIYRQRVFDDRKDHCLDRKQIVIGVVSDHERRTISCELLPGNTADVTTLIPVIDRLKARFGIEQECIVANRGMISDDTIVQLGQCYTHYFFTE